MTSRSSTCQRFVDYFIVCGLDLNSGLEPDRISGLQIEGFICFCVLYCTVDNLQSSPLERSYKSKVLAHFPENVRYNPFDSEAVNMLCLPKGLQFRTQKNVLEPHYHSFIITREDGTRNYGCAYIFYERVTSKKICAAMQTLQSMHLAELSGGGAIDQPDPGGGSNTRSLPRSFKLSAHNSPTASSFYDVSRDTLLVTKAIAVITQLPYVYSFHKFLSGLHRTVTATEHPLLPAECYIYNLLYEIPIPFPGQSMVFHCFGQNILSQRPGLNELPLLDYPLRQFFLLLNIENILQLFTCVLLENQILLVSRDYYKLMLVAESVTMLLFPFSWQHVYVPILPASLLHFLDAPVPFIMGLHHDGEEKFSLQVPGEANLCYVDIDGPSVALPEDLPQFPHRLEFQQELQELLVKSNIHAPQRPSQNDRNLNESAPHSYSRFGSIPRRRKTSWTIERQSDFSPRQFPYGNDWKEIVERSPAVQQLAAIAKRTGVIKSLDDLERPSRMDGEGNVRSPGKESDERKYLNDLKFNNAVREIFLNRFTHMFSAYEHFVIFPDQDVGMEQWLNCRESVQNFDKATFLSDQPGPHLPFLSRFIETQMFVSLIDNKILSQWEDTDLYLKLFDARVKVLRTRYGDSLVRTPSYEPCTTIKETQMLINKRSSAIDLTSPNPQHFDPPIQSVHRPGFFPQLDADCLNKKPSTNRGPKVSVRSRCKELLRQQMEFAAIRHEDSKDKYMQDVRAKALWQPKLSEMTTAAITQTNWNFVEQLLKECKSKTKRMLVEKMGQEAVELGHCDINITGVEENTLIASLCDLLERIWSHGLQNKQGKSALWSHLLSYQEIEECNDMRKPISANFLTPDLSTVALDANLPQKGKKKTPAKVADIPTIIPLPISLIFDMRNVQAMTEIKTEIGYARAWLRLSLEKKVLSKHLKVLLANHELLKSCYKRYAFLRCDDEKEQFLYHILTLNAVDYHCFTNAYLSTVIPYRVVIFPSRKFSASTTSANAWVCLSGTHGETGAIDVPKQSLELIFQYKNLGVLTTLRIGHDNSGMTPKWMVEHVLVRNEVTGHTYKFPCGRWLAKGIDDGSTERLLVGELVPASTDNEELMETCRTPPRCRSPNLPRRSTEQIRPSELELQQLLADAVNNIVKHYYKPERERGSLTILLCGEMGLVYCLEQIFLYGFKSARLFGRHLYLWDFFVRVQGYFETVLQDESDRSTKDEEQIAVMTTYCSLVEKINVASHTVGKDGKFQVFICLATREHLLHRMILHVASTPITQQMYEDYSFLRDQNLITFLLQILDSLSEFPFVLESSLTKGISN
uniref:DENN domain-containing protein 5B n=1 Tax=Strigamia maritima TaxID=126957 RepID=T1IME6_STRMM